MESWYNGKIARIVIHPYGGIIVPMHLGNLIGEMADTDKVLQIFVDDCNAAGPDDCAFYVASSAKISSNLDKLTASVKAQPVPVITSISYGILGYTFLRNLIFDALYNPYDLFSLLAQSLAALANGNASTMYIAIEVPSFECECNTVAQPFHDNGYEAAVTIACGDATPVNDSVLELQDFYSAETTISSFADLWGNWRVLCS